MRTLRQCQWVGINLRRWRNPTPAQPGIRSIRSIINRPGKRAHGHLKTTRHIPTHLIQHRRIPNRSDTTPWFAIGPAQCPGADQNNPRSPDPLPFATPHCELADCSFSHHPSAPIPPQSRRKSHCSVRRSARQASVVNAPPLKKYFLYPIRQPDSELRIFRQPHKKVLWVAPRECTVRALLQRVSGRKWPRSVPIQFIRGRQRGFMQQGVL